MEAGNGEKEKERKVRGREEARSKFSSGDVFPGLPKNHGNTQMPMILLI